MKNYSVVREDKANNIPKGNYQLILYDNSVNSFDEVIDSLMEILGHNIYQAEQCATLVHHKGEIGILRGTKKILEQKSQQLNQYGLTTKVKKKKI